MPRRKDKIGRRKFLGVLGGACLAAAVPGVLSAKKTKGGGGMKTRPNVILVMTDDQGYGDLGCTGNPWIKTPNIDSFHSEGVRCPDFHVQPLCTPTRGALMTGRRPVRNGAWATCWGRSILRKDEVTMAEVFRANGYATGMFGKWHLGDNYPYRPFDRGFERTVAHKGGGVGQTPDFWGNNYFDDSYYHNGKLKKHEGYCTDIWFKHALEFIEANKSRSFFAYIATNAPHDPYLVAERYCKPYSSDDRIPYPAFCGMIANIDENLGKLDRRLKNLGLSENTILIFMTDNGSSGAGHVDRKGFLTKGFNAGMRGKKGWYYDGGHRVPFFVRWPKGGLAGGRDVDEMCLDVDLLPTLIELCGLENPGKRPFDGLSLAALLAGRSREMPDRVNFLNILQKNEPPEKTGGAVMTKRWRLVHGRELYDIKRDPGQKRDVAAENPEIVKELLAELDSWWSEVSPGFAEQACISIGHEAENPTTLTAMDVMGDVVWHQAAIVEAMQGSGDWNVDVESPGRYRFVLRRWPEELPLAIDAAASEEDANRVIYGPAKRNTIQPAKASIVIQGCEESVAVRSGDEEARLELDLRETGPTVLKAAFLEKEGEVRGAYYVTVERL